jgi:hypothetical protein
MRSATVLGGSIQTGTLISYSIPRVPAWDRRCGPLASKPTLSTRIVNKSVLDRQQLVDLAAAEAAVTAYAGY